MGLNSFEYSPTGSIIQTRHMCRKIILCIMHTGSNENHKKKRERENTMEAMEKVSALSGSRSQPRKRIRFRWRYLPCRRVLCSCLSRYACTHPHPDWHDRILRRRYLWGLVTSKVREDDCGCLKEKDVRARMFCSPKDGPTSCAQACDQKYFNINVVTTKSTIWPSLYTWGNFPYVGAVTHSYHCTTVIKAQRSRAYDFTDQYSSLLEASTPQPTMEMMWSMDRAPGSE